MFGSNNNKKFSHSEDAGWTSILWRFEPLLCQPKPYAQQPSSWSSTAIPRWLAEASAAENMFSWQNLNRQAHKNGSNAPPPPPCLCCRVTDWEGGGRGWGGGGNRPKQQTSHTDFTCQCIQVWKSTSATAKRALNGQADQDWTSNISKTMRG